VPLRPVAIPSGKSENELWKIFEILAGLLGQKEEVVFDVTHAFRSLPILSLLAVAYLRVAHQVNLRALVYGAFEARDANNRAPVFDLTPFLRLLDWVTATDQFLQTGNAERLAGLLPGADPHTGPLAQSVTGIAQGLHLLRPMDVMREAAALPAHIDTATPGISQVVPPFASLIQRVRTDYGAFGLPNPTDHAANGKESLVRQLRMIEWYAAKKQVVHALSLAREWLPSLLCYHFRLDPLNEVIRADMELLLRGGKDHDEDGNVVRQSNKLAEWPGVPCGKQLRSLWGGGLNLANLRNDALHAGFRKKPKSAEKITELTSQVIAQLKEIEAAWPL
jgi:CRISPR-associated DxTHG motif protein